MPITVPPYVQLQIQTPPLRGLWNSVPREGDRYLSAEIDWLVQTSNLNCVCFTLHSNSPVALSQVVALYVDNSRCASDVSFLFPDTGFDLVVAAKNQGLYPVLTNALTFFVTALQAGASDITIVQILNSMMPPIAIVATQSPAAAAAAQNHVAVNGITVANSSTPVIAAGVNGTLNTIQIQFDLANAAGQHGTFALYDGTGTLLWSAGYTIPAGQTFIQPVVNLQGLSLRFQNGINFTVTGSTFAGNSANVNLYYSTP
jgi:hypothetical protein